MAIRIGSQAARRWLLGGHSCEAGHGRPRWARVGTAGPPRHRWDVFPRDGPDRAACDPMMPEDGDLRCYEKGIVDLGSFAESSGWDWPECSILGTTFLYCRSRARISIDQENPET
jgi:hypothetical protein